MRNHFSRLKFRAHHIKEHLKEGGGSAWKKSKYIFAGAVAFIIALCFFTFFAVIITLPNIDNIRNLVAAQSSLILDRNGEVLYAIHGDENRKIVPYDQISPYAAQAVMAIEDDEFYDHHGVDFKAFLIAVCGEMHICNTARGGSTITQQFVKNAFLSPERSYTRKAKEIILALQLEGRYTKDEIMEMYLNRIPYGANIYGVEVASQIFFGKPAAELTIAESAILAAIPKAPTYYSPYGNNIYAKVDLSEEEILKRDIRSENELVDFISKGLLGKTYTYGEGEEARDIYIKGRVDFVLERMEELGYITSEESLAASAEANAIEFKPFREDIVAPHFVMYVRQLLEEKYGKEALEKGGLRVTTTLDVEKQKAADKAVEAQAEANEEKYGATNAALISLDPDTGEILAMVGSRDFWNDEIDGKVNITLRPRLPGSSFKPIVYAAAFLQGYAPSTVVYDVRTKFGAWYEPENFDGTFLGPIDFRHALGASRNIPAVKAGHLAGIPNVMDLARKMGIDLNQPDDWYGLSLALGAGEARPLDMARAYGVFANGGYKVEPVAILKVEDRAGNILEEYKAPDKKNLILDPQVAYLINNVLSDVSARPDEYWQAQLSIPGQVNGAKTGTSNKKKDDVNYPFDLWTIGYTRHLVTAVWAGNADGSHVGRNASGLDTAAHIWKPYMTEATKDMPRADFERPEGIKWIKVAKRSGKLPSEHTPEDEIVSGVFASFSVPTEYDNAYQFVEIDKISGKLATEFTPEEAREKKAFFTHHSILPENPQWESAVRAWAVEKGEDEKPPTEYDDVHTAETMDTKPQITITSPKSKSEVSPPSLSVWVDISSPAGVEKVDYYFDDVLVDTATISPFTGSFAISKSLKNGSEHNIKTVVYDELYRSSQSSISVKIGTDETPPVVSFIYPSDGAALTAGTSISVQLDARDPNGSVKKVNFYLDGQMQKEDISSPFNWQLTVPGEKSEYELKAVAYDQAGNKTSESITIKVDKETVELSGSSRILLPRDNANLNEGDQVLVKAFVAEDDRNNLADIYFLTKKAGQLPDEIAKINTANEAGAATYSVIWASPPAGTYELYLKIVLTDGKLRFSKKIPVVVR
ncbi:transglycosylase domain-containing protein [Patescibacteria group bacterium]|nr:transglycosylase domain-containing protein [Patescibacteria group bacterium]MBU1015750.1 transglycosylase domain-containing protein [Patescibacteria group bacterium]MBU1685512.1 transglycosylase domain-containing protein [Patescibacteria group bacterium]MBU1938702.1 transglycosylase domain-containing protein [Patescibacteria group bacterium]